MLYLHCVKRHARVQDKKWLDLIFGYLFWQS